MTYIVQFDKWFLEGNLAGLTIPGCTVTSSDRASAERLMGFYSRVATDDDFIRDAGTGNRFKVSNVLLHAPAR